MGDQSDSGAFVEFEQDMYDDSNDPSVRPNNSIYEQDQEDYEDSGFQHQNRYNSSMGSSIDEITKDSEQRLALKVLRSVMEEIEE